MQTMIGENPNTTANAKSLLWAAARKGKASAQGKVRRHVKAGTWTDAQAIALLADVDTELDSAEVGTPDHYRLSAVRAYLVAASSTTTEGTTE